MKTFSFIFCFAPTISILTVGCASENNPTDPCATTPYSGNPPDQEFLLDWYSEYDDGQNTDYLENLGTMETETLFNKEYDVRRDMPYGPHGERTTMDVYLPNDATSATPIVMFAHGGGFGSKDKTDILSNRSEVLAGFLEKNIAVASINYRFKSKGVPESTSDSVWDCKGTVSNNDGCRLDVIYRDGARAIQYLRYRNDVLNIDSNRIGAWGRSAGSQITTWVSLAPDLAVADHQDPVLRESTRIHAVGHTNSQATGPSHLWPDIVYFQQESEEYDQLSLWERLSTEEEATCYNDALQSNIEELEETQQGQDLIRVVHFLEMIDASAPPMIFTSPVQDHTCEALEMMSDDDLQGTMVHHPRHLEPLYQRCLDEKGEDECNIVTAVQDSYSDERGADEQDPWKDDENELLNFMIDALLGDDS